MVKKNEMYKEAQKTQYIENLGQEVSGDIQKNIPIVDLNGDGNFGKLETEIAKMETEIDRMKQGISDEIELGMLGDLKSILTKIKSGASISELKILIEQAMNKKKSINTELNKTIHTSKKEKEDKLDKELDELLKKIEEVIKEKEKDMEVPDIEIEPNTQKDKSFIDKVILALKTVFEGKSNKMIQPIDNKEKEKEKDIPIQATIIEQKKKEQNQLKKEISTGPEIQQNEELIGVIKNLANSGEVKLLEEVLNDNKNKLQVDDYAKALDKKVAPDMNIDKLKVELKSKAMNNRIKKVESKRSIAIHKTVDLTKENPQEISPRLLRAHEKDKTSTEPGLERTLNFNDNNKY